MNVDDDDNDLPLTYANFEDAPGVGMRIFYDATSGLLDPLGDNELRSLHLDTAFSADFNLDRYIELVTRPFILCKRANNGTSRTEFNFTRPPRSRDSEVQVSTPFDPLADTVAPPSVLFDDATLVPLLTGRVIAFDLRPRAASGTFTFEQEEE